MTTTGMTLAAEIREGAAIVVCGLVPLVGLLFLGWSTSMVIFMLWFDAYLGSMRIIPGIVYLIDSGRVSRPLNPVARAIDGAGMAFMGVFLWVFASMPVQIAGRFLDDMVAQLHPGGFGAEFSDMIHHAPWSFAVLLGSRVYQARGEFVVARAAGPSRFPKMIKALYGLLTCKGVMLFALAGVSGLFVLGGPGGAKPFAAMAILALIAIELYAQRWFHPQRADAIPPANDADEVIQTSDARE